MKGNERESTDRAGLSLGSALKLSGLVETGGQAKTLIQEGAVKVNGQVERRRKRKVTAGDEIEVDGETFVIELEGEP
ncbi:MAG TPA: RNA-binding S4 domain-containing protein [Trueperaceae bacterium]